MRGEGKRLAEASREDLEDFTLWGQEELKSVNKYLWGIGYYYEYISNPVIGRVAGELRGKKIKRQPLALKKFRGVKPEHVEKLLAVGIKDVNEMLHDIERRLRFFVPKVVLVDEETTT